MCECMCMHVYVCVCVSMCGVYTCVCVCACVTLCAGVCIYVCGCHTLPHMSPFLMKLVLSYKQLGHPLSHCVQTAPDLHLRPHTAEPILQRSVTIAQVCSPLIVTKLLPSYVIRSWGRAIHIPVCLLVSGSNVVPCHWRNSSGVQSLRTVYVKLVLFRLWLWASSRYTRHQRRKDAITC